MKKIYLKTLQHYFFHVITLLGGLISLTGFTLVSWALSGNVIILPDASYLIGRIINASAGILAIYSGVVIMSISRFIVKNLPD